jgi:hypothetical protein
MAKFNKTILTIAFVLALVVGGFGQSSSGALSASDAGTCATANACLSVPLYPNAGSVGLSLSGTFSATLQFEVSADNGVTWVSAQGTTPAGATATSATAGGTWRFAVSGLTNVRVRCSAFTSGSVNVVIQGSSTAASLGGSSSGGGTVTHTAGALTSGAVMVGNGAADAKVDANVTDDGAGNLTATSISLTGSPMENLGGGIADPACSTSFLFWGSTTLANRFGMCLGNSVTDYVVGRATTDTLTNKTFDTAGAGNSLKINGTAITGLSGCTDFWTAGAQAPTWTAGHTYCPSTVGTYTFAAAQAVSVNNVTIYCSNPGMVLQRTGATDGFDVSGNSFTLQGCTLDGNSQSAAGTGPIVNVTGNDAHIYNNVFANTGVTSPSTAFIYQTAGARMKVDFNTGICSDNCVIVQPAASTIVSDWEAIADFLTVNAAATIRGISENDQNTSAGVAGGLISNNSIRFQDGGNQGFGIGCNNTIAPALGITRSYGLRIENNLVFATGTYNSLYHCFGLVKATVSGNIGNDNNQAAGNYVFDFGDVNDSTFTGNQGFAINATGSGVFHWIDFSRIVVSGNQCSGQQTSGSCYKFENVAGLASQSKITGNNAALNATAGTCYKLVENTGSFSFTDDSFGSNDCSGTGTASQVGWSLTNTTGTFANINIQDSKIINVPTGLSVGNSVTGVVFDNPFWDTVTTHYSLGTGLVQVHDLTGLTFANIPANLANGSTLYVSDSTIANPCAGSGTGAILKRLNGVNVCN